MQIIRGRTTVGVNLYVNNFDRQITFVELPRNADPIEQPIRHQDGRSPQPADSDGSIGHLSATDGQRSTKKRTRVPASHISTSPAVARTPPSTTALTH
jgi:hypothetical protein